MTAPAKKTKHSLDQMPAAIAAERLKTERDQAAGWAEVVARMQKHRPTKRRTP